MHPKKRPQKSPHRDGQTIVYQFPGGNPVRQKTGELNSTRKPAAKA
ncbi:MAG: hypothetical protein ABI758_06715 [Candidatus Woesebacteria bacterium]